MSSCRFASGTHSSILLLTVDAQRGAIGPTTNAGSRQKRGRSSSAASYAVAEASFRVPGSYPAAPVLPSPSPLTLAIMHVILVVVGVTQSPALYDSGRVALAVAILAVNQGVNLQWKCDLQFSGGHVEIRELHIQEDQASVQVRVDAMSSHVGISQANLTVSGALNSQLKYSSPNNTPFRTSLPRPEGSAGVSTMSTGVTSDSVGTLPPMMRLPLPAPWMQGHASGDDTVAGHAPPLRHWVAVSVPTRPGMSCMTGAVSACTWKNMRSASLWLSPFAPHLPWQVLIAIDGRGCRGGTGGPPALRGGPRARHLPTRMVGLLCRAAAREAFVRPPRACVQGVGRLRSVSFPPHAPMRCSKRLTSVCRISWGVLCLHAARRSAGARACRPSRAASGQTLGHQYPALHHTITGRWRGTCR